MSPRGRAQANLPAVAVALLLLTATTGLALTLADSAFASADRDPADRRVAASLADRIVADDSPLTRRANVLDADAVSPLPEARLDSRFPVVEGRDVRIRLDDRILVERGSPDGGATVRRVVLVAEPQFASRAPGYGMPGRVIDGNDPFAVYETVGEAVGRARAGHGPSFVEARTVRIGGHLAHDPQRYRPDGEVADARARDPIDRFRRRLEAEGVLDAGGFEELETAVEAEILAAVEFARESPFPDAETAYEDLWADPPSAGVGGQGGDGA